jgi:hypothetical protein
VFFQQREKTFRKIREEKIKHIKFVNNDMEGLPYDFKVKEFKVQEKVASFNNKNGVTFFLYKNNGKDNGKRQFTSYKKDDNDFYWLNLPDKKHFYVFPQEILINYGYVNSNRKQLKFSFNTIKKKDWKLDYLFEYDNIDEKRLLDLFGIIM